LEAYEESWKSDHGEAMDCRDWEDAIAIGINIFHMIQERDEAWREQVFRGTTLLSDEDNIDHLGRYARWLETTREVLAENLPGLEARFGSVAGANELRLCAERAERIVSEWQPPKLSAAVGLREITLSREAAAEFERILQGTKNVTPESPAPIMQEIVYRPRFV